jgi:cell division transport system ATP-binding protein
MIRFEQVSKRYQNGDEVLSNLSFDVTTGEMCFLTGHSGAGKSTLLKLINGLEDFNGGEVVVNGQGLRQLPAKHLPQLRRNVGMVYQDHRLLQDRTVFDNVALPLVIAGAQMSDMQSKVRAALDKVGLLAKERAYPQSLSGGEQQRVGIARAVVHKPAILLADEPTGNLDPELSAHIMSIFTEFQRVGVTILIATHNLAVIARMRHRILTLEHGKMIDDGQH